MSLLANSIGAIHRSITAAQTSANTTASQASLAKTPPPSAVSNRPAVVPINARPGAAMPAPTPAPTPAPPKTAPSSPAATVPDYSGVTKEIGGIYDAQRSKAAQQEAANLQGQREAMDRRFAAMGGGPGGAAIKAEEQLGNESAQRLQSADADINAAQSGDMRNVEMTKLGQQFQSGERQAGQQFQAGQQQNEIEAQKGMQITGINAQSTLADKQTAAQELMQKTGISAQEAMQQVQLKQSASQFEQTMGLEKQKFDEQTGVDQFNENMADKMFNKKDMLESFFSNFSMGNITGGLQNFFSNAGGGFKGPTAGGAEGGGGNPAFGPKDSAGGGDTVASPSMLNINSLFSGYW